MSGSDNLLFAKGSRSRREFLAMSGMVGAAALASAMIPGSAFALDAVAPETLIWDSQSRGWIPYTPDRAQRFYQRNGTVPAEMRRRVVAFRADEKPGTIVIDADKHHLYVVMPGGRAMRYGIGVGRDGFGWAGIVKVGRKAEWPRWTPPAEMVQRDAKAARWADGMPGGPDNPLGARALYLYQGGRDTIYRIHGTSEPWSIGLNVSSGCVRLLNDDVADLYDRVPVGAKVVVLAQNAQKIAGLL